MSLYKNITGSGQIDRRVRAGNTLACTATPLVHYEGVRMCAMSVCVVSNE